MELIAILTTLGFIYGSICVVFYFIQDFFLFHPERLPHNFIYQYPFPYREINFEMEDGGRINGILFEVPNSKGVVFYFKGNTRSIKGWGKFAKDFVGKGYDFFVMDYRGFGKSRGLRTEETIYNDSQHVYLWLKNSYPEDKIIIYGRSLGSGFATRIASWNNPKMLILDSPYFSFYDQVKRYAFWLPITYLLKYRIRTDQFIKKVKCPIFLIHGKKDRLFPFSFSVRLQELVPDSATLIPIEKAHHNNLPEFAEYHDRLYEILNE
jgi:pimeloyl-ACP methyl ester carboxylesterase